MASLTSFAKGLVTHTEESRAEVLLIDLNATDTRDILLETGEVVDRTLALQYYPASLRDVKEINYQKKEIPGSSLPLYQWISSGERVISFTSYFSCDMDLLTLGSEQGQAMYDKLKAVGESRRNVDIRAAQIWLRRFMLPFYGSGSQTSQVGTPLTFSPRRLKLEIPNSGIGLIGGDTGGGTADTDSMVCLLSQCDFDIMAWHPSGLPKLATAQLAFIQVAQSAGQVSFPHRSSRMEFAVDGLESGIIGYRIRRANAA